jgi:hypothetical protein
VEYKDFKLVYRHYASLYIVVGITESEVLPHTSVDNIHRGSSGLFRPEEECRTGERIV